MERRAPSSAGPTKAQETALLTMTDTTLYPIFVRQGRSKTRFKVGYINQRGEVVIDPIFDYATRFYEGLAAVEVRNRWGVINASGEFAIQPQSRGWCRFRDGLASISVKGKWGIIDRSGKFVLKPKYDYLESFREGRAVFRLGGFQQSRTWRYGYLDKNGAEAIPAVFHNAYGFSEGLAAAKVGSLGATLTRQASSRLRRALKEQALGSAGPTLELATS